MNVGAPMLHVMAGVLVDGAGRVLLAQRPVGKELAGCWEFPGGKREPGESPAAALARELAEELGIVVLDSVAWRTVKHAHGERMLLLDAWRVRAWRGEPTGREGQALAWRDPAEVVLDELAPADRPLLEALRAPD